MTNKTESLSPASAIRTDASVPAAGIDWQLVADQRLTRLVEIEHDHSVMRDRLALLQVDYREMLVASDQRLRRLAEQDQERVKLERRLAELAREHARMHASFVESRSWRLTRPLRLVATWRREGRHRPGNLVRAMLRVPLFRRAARWVVRLVPGLHARLRSRLYPRAAGNDHGNVH